MRGMGRYLSSWARAGRGGDQGGWEWVSRMSGNGGAFETGNETSAGRCFLVEMGSVLTIFRERKCVNAGKWGRGASQWRRRNLGHRAKSRASTPNPSVLSQLEQIDLLRRRRTTSRSITCATGNISIQWHIINWGGRSCILMDGHHYWAFIPGWRFVRSYISTKSVIKINLSRFVP